MKKSDREILRIKISSELDSLKKNITDLQEFTKPIEPENAIGRVSRMDAINNKSVNEAALNTALQKLHKLEIALGKIDSDEFGICTRCGATIQEGRLMFMPESYLCVRCANL